MELGKTLFGPLLSVPLLIAVVGCTAQKSFWAEKEAQENPLHLAKIPHVEDSRFHPNLRIVEYDDNGDRWERMQLISALDAIRKSREGSPVVVFAHGWRHNANPEDSDLKSFNAYLHWWESKNPGRKIVGIFIGWRGASVYEKGALRLPATVPMAMSFPDRRKATARIAGVTLAADLWSIRRAANDNHSKLILVGHSFGGRILENVTSQSIVAYHNSRSRPADGSAELETTSSGYSPRDRTSRLIADLVVLLNPASESLIARQIKLAIRGWPDTEPPALVSLTSKTDDATGMIWPIGKSYEKALSPLRARPERVYKTGHHVPNIKDGFETQWSYEATVSGFDPRQIAADVDYDCITDSFRFSNINLDNHGMSNRGYLVLSAGPCLLDGHGNEKSNCSSCGPNDGDFGIFSPSISKFVSELVNDATSGNYPSTRLYHRLHPAR